MEFEDDILLEMEEDSQPGWGGFPPEAWEKDSYALIACDGHGNGCVLETGGPAVAMEMEEMSSVLGDIGLDDAPHGLSVWRGRLRVYKGGYWSEDEGEVCLEGGLLNSRLKHEQKLKKVEKRC